MMGITYRSTRGGEQAVSPAEAIIRGLAADGGLYVPSVFPKPFTDLADLDGLGYHELAFRVMQPFFADFSEAELRECIARAYDTKFDTPDIAPLCHRAGVFFLELYHGPTLAFKDMALAILPHLMKTAARKLGINKEIVILTATSGDTGKAALEGFAGVVGTKIIVFFPEHGVSPVQKRQMVTQEGDNTFVIGIEGNFDDAQNGVKAIFADTELEKRLSARGYLFSSANSINIGRLVPQVVYYFYAYFTALQKGLIRDGEEVNFAVPTGNFGNILAGYYAKKLGLPVRRLICASNENRVLYDFLLTGTYDRNRKFMVTMSPSMDILVSSNLERLLFEAGGKEGGVVRELMQKLQATGCYQITEAMKLGLLDFFGGYATETETAQAIRDVFVSSGYLIDPHTAVAYAVYQKFRAQTGDQTKAVVVATASPFKFPGDVMVSLDGKYRGADEFALIREMSLLTGNTIPQAIKDLEKRPVLHSTVCTPGEMRLQVEKILGL